MVLLTLRLGNLDKAVSAVRKMVLAGKRVVFDSEADGGSYVFDKKKQKYLKIRDRSGVYCVRVRHEGEHAGIENNSDKQFAGEGS